MVAINSTSSSAERRASHSRSPVCERVWMILAATWPLSFCELLTWLGRAGLSGKTSPASCHPLADGTLAVSSGRWASSGMGGATECLTLSSSECPSDAVASSLSGILEIGDLPPRYFLSRRACEGILRRAAKRGRALPAPLRQALEAQVQRNNN